MLAKLVKAYSIQHRFDAAELVDSYHSVLTSVLNDVWNSIRWKREGKRLIPYLRGDNQFKKSLRNFYLIGWKYSKHYVDSAIKQAYSILSSWRKLYLKGKASRDRPALKRKFVRIKGTLFSYRNGVIKISIKPHQESVSIDLKRAWFWER